MSDATDNRFYREPADPAVDGDPKDTVRAVQLTEDADWEAIAAWCGGRLINHRGPDDEYTTELRLEPSGLGAFQGDWIVRNGYGGVHIVSGDTWPFGEQKTTTTALVDRDVLQELRDDRDGLLAQPDELRAENSRLANLVGEYELLAAAVNRALDVAPFTSIGGLIEALASRPAIPADAPTAPWAVCMGIQDFMAKLDDIPTSGEWAHVSVRVGGQYYPVIDVEPAEDATTGEEQVAIVAALPACTGDPACSAQLHTAECVSLRLKADLLLSDKPTPPVGSDTAEEEDDVPDSAFVAPVHPGHPAWTAPVRRMQPWPPVSSGGVPDA